MNWTYQNNSGATPDVPKPNNEVIFKEPSFIEIVDNSIYFFSEIEREKVLQLIKNIRLLNVNQSQTQKNLNLKESIGIYLFINSYGGDVFTGLSAMDEIIGSGLPITTVVDGCCASAATFFSIVGKRRFIKPHSFMLIHQISSIFWGKYREFKDEMENLKKIMKVIKSIYSQYTKLPEKKINEILEHDLWLDAKECLKYGLVDEIGFGR